MTADPKHMCLMLLIDQDQQRIVLGHKLRGFGKGNVIAPGGKIDPGETVTQAAVRELHEETGLVVDPAEVTDAGELLFTWADPLAQHFRVTLRTASKWQGELTPSDELDPFWCDFAKIEYVLMWDDDRFWLPGVLRGNAVHAVFGYDADQKYVTSADLTFVPIQDAD